VVAWPGLSFLTSAIKPSSGILMVLIS